MTGTDVAIQLRKRGPEGNKSEFPFDRKHKFEQPAVDATENKTRHDPLCFIYDKEIFYIRQITLGKERTGYF